MSTVRLCLVVFALCVLTAFVDSTRPAPYDICSFSCVKQIYEDYCGGATCVAGTSTDLEKAHLCSEPCIQALSGTYMLNCLQSNDPSRMDFEDLIQRNLQTINGVCEDIASAPAIAIEQKHDYTDLE